MDLPALSRYRASQPAVSFGPGLHFVSPQKRAPKRKLVRTAVAFIDLDARRRRAQKEFDELFFPTKATPSFDEPAPSHQMEVDPDTEWEDEEEDEPGSNAPNAPDENAAPSMKSGKSKRLIPDHRSVNLYCKWRGLLPTLVQPLLVYTAASIGKAAQAVTGDLEAVCGLEGAPLCEINETTVLSLYFDRMYQRCIFIPHFAVS